MNLNFVWVMSFMCTANVKMDGTKEHSSVRGALDFFQQALWKPSEMRIPLPACLKLVYEPGFGRGGGGIIVPPL